MSRVYLLIVVCSLSTMTPRILPYFLPRLKKCPRFIKKCMCLLPVASLGPLIFPLALIDFSPYYLAGLVGVLSSFGLSYFKVNMVISIIFSLILTSLTLFIFFG